jgi:hypothetical protein
MAGPDIEAFKTMHEEHKSIKIDTAVQRRRMLEAFGKCLVLAVGVSRQLAEAELASLKVCANDAHAIVEVFLTQDALNADRDWCIELSRLATLPPTKAVILGKLKDIAGRAEADERLIFYFSGHGIKINEALYLAPEDAYSSDDTNALISLVEVEAALNLSRAKQKIIVLDSCHSGQSTKNFKSAFTVSRSFLEKYLKVTEGIAVLAASTAEQRANVRSPDPDHSLFTYYLLHALRGESAALDEGVLTLYGLHGFLSVEVARRAKSDHFTTPQSPVLYSSTTGDLLLGDFGNFPPVGAPLSSASESPYLPGSPKGGRTVDADPEITGQRPSRDPVELAVNYPQLLTSTTGTMASLDGVRADVVRRRVEVLNELWALRHRVLPPKRHPDMDWDEALEDIALNLGSHAVSLHDIVVRMGAMLPSRVTDALESAASAAQDGSFEVSRDNNPEVSRQAREAAERMYDLLIEATKQLRASLTDLGIRLD